MTTPPADAPTGADWRSIDDVPVAVALPDPPERFSEGWSSAIWRWTRNPDGGVRVIRAFRWHLRRDRPVFHSEASTHSLGRRGPDRAASPVSSGRFPPVGKEVDIAPELLEVITHVVAQAEGRGLGAFHADLTEARVGWSQVHRGAEITGYSFTDWSGRSAAASSVDRSLGWSHLRARLVQPVGLASRPVTSTAGLLALLAGASNGVGAAADEIRQRWAGSSPAGWCIGDPSGRRSEGLFAGGEVGLVGGGGPPVGFRVEEVVGPGCGDAVLVPPAGVTTCGEDREVAVPPGAP